MVSMTILMSLVTSVKDYVEIAHKLIESSGPLAPWPQNSNLATSLMDNSLTANPNSFFVLRDYTEFGAVLTYIVLSIKEFLTNFFTLQWLSNIWSLPLIVPDITSAMISEISVLDSYFTNAFSFLEKGISTTLQSNVNTLNLATDNLVSLEKINQNPALFGFEKFMVGFLNSFFLFLPSSTAHLITARRFVMQGIEAGFMAGLGTIAGNFLWLASIILGLRFIVIPWLSLDIFRYILGFMLLVKYLWDSSKDLNKNNQARNTILDTNAKNQIFLLNFLLALTEQTSIYPFISNMSFGAEGSILEGFQMLGTGSDNVLPFFGIHICYLLGILVGSFSLLQFAVWFWENPAFSIYMWIIASKNNLSPGGAGTARVNTSTYYKVVNFVFLYLTMLCAISSIPYFGLDYTITKPLGLIPQDRMIDQKLATATGKSEPIFQEFSFLGVKPTDKNSRTKDGVHARRERWKERLIKYQAFDGSLYGQGVYDILTVEDLNYGFDRFWLRRKMRNHQIRFRLFPGPWMRSVKKQLNKPGSQGPRMEFFRILFEQYYHPSFGKKAVFNPNSKTLNNLIKPIPISTSLYNQKLGTNLDNGGALPLPTTQENFTQNTLTSKAALQKGLISQYSALRKFSSNVNLRLAKSLVNNQVNLSNKALLYPQRGPASSDPGMQSQSAMLNSSTNAKPIYSKSFKNLFSQMKKSYSFNNFTNFRTLSKNLLIPKMSGNLDTSGLNKVAKTSLQNLSLPGLKLGSGGKKTFFRKKLSKKERLLLIYKSNLYNKSQSALLSNLENPTLSMQISHWPQNLLANQKETLNQQMVGSLMLGLQKGQQSLQPLNYYLQKKDLFKLKLQYYSTAITRKFSPGNNQPYFKTLLKRAFYYHKPSLRLKRTLFTAAMRRGFRKKSTQPKKLLYQNNNFNSNLLLSGKLNNLDLTGSGSTIQNQAEQNNLITKDSSQYTVLGKANSRYRYQIYKDVLQHWYYSPFNRLLLKFDIDSFMARQPKPHFLTKKEERLLHLRRVLLYEHYNTLRWYTYMQHYLTMKSNIGGTKSFASTAYNQQFQGTFKKIRHLFYITPSQGPALSGPTMSGPGSGQSFSNFDSYGDISILKFDQPLYNTENVTKNSSLMTSNKQTSKESNPNQKAGTNPKINSGAYKHWNLGATTPSTVDNSQKPLQDFQDSALMLSGALMLSNTAGNIQTTSDNKTNFPGKEKEGSTQARISQDSFNSKIVLLDLLKQSKKFLNNPTFLKNYISHRIEKRSEQLRTASPQNTKETKSIMADSLKNWYSPTYGLHGRPRPGSGSLNNSFGASSETKLNTKVAMTTGIRKALNDGVFVLNNKNPAQQNKAFFTKENLSLKFTDKKALDGLSNVLKVNTKTEEQLKQTLTSTLSFTKNNLEKNQFTKGKQTFKAATKSQVYKTIALIRKASSQTLKPILLLQNKILKKRSEKTLEWWRQKQRVMSKLKSSRKKSRYKNIKASVSQKNTPARGSSVLNSSNTALLQSYLLPVETLGTLRKKTDNNNSKASNSTDKENNFQNLYTKFFVRKFQKQAKGRRYRSLAMTGSRGFAYVRKPKNINSFTNVSGYFESLNPVLQLNSEASNKLKASLLLSKEEKNLFLALALKDFKKNLASNIVRSQSKNTSELTKNSLQTQTDTSLGVNAATKLKNLLIQGYVKKSPSKKRSKRTWKKRKRQKFTKNHYKYRKRQIHGLGKVIVLAKKMKKAKATLQFQNWWWNSYLPDAASKAMGSSSTKINVNGISFKPLSSQRALDIISSSNDTNKKSFTPNLTLPINLDGVISQDGQATNNLAKQPDKSILDLQPTQNAVNGAFSVHGQGQDQAVGLREPLKSVYNTTAIPFYAGWDDSLRKFVVTNRLLSRTKAGSEVDLTRIFQSSNQQTLQKSPSIEPKAGEFTQADLSFNKAPIKGLNEGQFLFLQNEMPFNSYIIDQFIPNNQSFYAPLGWSNFQFKHSLLKTWLTNNLKTNQNATIMQTETGGKTNLLSNTDKAIYINKKPQSLKSKNLLYLKNRRIKKRYKLLKQTPIQLMYVPTGQLLTQTLPSHYISVFDKQYRFPRNIFIKRSLPNSKTLTNTQLAQGKGSTNLQSMATSANIKDLTILEYSNQAYNLNNEQPEFTLRKRIKPRRKYHKKRLYKKDFSIFPRRAKFGNFSNTNTGSQAQGENESFRLRPSTILTSKTAVTSAKKAKKNNQTRNATKTNPVRLRQLRRREFSQVFKPLQRFQPRYGGFTWPGDYLRLEVIPMPKLEALNQTVQNALLQSESTNNQTKDSKLNTPVSPNNGLALKSKAKINVQPVGLLPRKYFVQKHNLKVFKKKMYLKYS